MGIVGMWRGGEERSLWKGEKEGAGESGKFEKDCRVERC